MYIYIYIYLFYFVLFYRVYVEYYKAVLLYICLILESSSRKIALKINRLLTIIYIYLCVYIHIYIYIKREREREREIEILTHHTVYMCVIK